MSHCWCKCEAGVRQCGPKVPKLKTLFSAQHLGAAADAAAGFQRAERLAELQSLWEDLGEDRGAQTKALQAAVSTAVTGTYSQALEHAAAQLSELEREVASYEQRLHDLLGPDASLAIAPKALGLKQRRDTNRTRLHELQSEHAEGFEWVGSLVVLAELQRRVSSLRGSSPDTSMASPASPVHLQLGDVRADELGGYGTVLNPRLRRPQLGSGDEDSSVLSPAPSSSGSAPTDRHRGLPAGRQRGSEARLALFQDAKGLSPLATPVPEDAVSEDDSLLSTPRANQAPRPRSTRREAVLQTLQEVAAQRKGLDSGAATASDSDSQGARARGPSVVPPAFYDSELDGVYEPPTFSLPQQQKIGNGQAHAAGRHLSSSSSAGRECQNGSVEGPLGRSQPHTSASRAQGAPKEGKQKAGGGQKKGGSSWWFSSSGTGNSASNGSSSSSSSQDSDGTHPCANPSKLRDAEGSNAVPPVLRRFAGPTPWGAPASPATAPSSGTQKEAARRNPVKHDEAGRGGGGEEQGVTAPLGAKGQPWALLPTRLFHWQAQVGKNGSTEGGDTALVKRRDRRRRRPTGSFVPSAFGATTPALQRMPASLSLSLLNALSLAHPSAGPAASAAVLAEAALASLAVPAPLPQRGGPGRRRTASPWYTLAPQGGAAVRADPGWRTVTSAVQKSVGVVQGYAAVVTRGRSTAALEWGEAGFRAGAGVGGAQRGLPGASSPHFGAMGSSAGPLKGSAPGPRPAKAGPPPVQRSTTLPPIRPPGAHGKTPPPPPPPPPGMLAKGTFTKGDFRGGPRLKRSSTMGQLYRGLKSRMEMGGLGGRVPSGAVGAVGGGQGVGSGRTVGWERGVPDRRGGGGMVAAASGAGLADALLEISRKSAYFQQVEADVATHAQAVWRAKAELEAFASARVPDLLHLHTRVEALLEPLSDESQVLQRFEDFPSKKLEMVRMAAAYHGRMQALVQQLGAWEVSSAPGSSALDEIERAEKLLDKVRKEVEPLERSQEEDVRRLAQHCVPYDTSTMASVKEAVVKMSARLLAHTLNESLKLRQELCQRAVPEGKQLTSRDLLRLKAGHRTLWRAFQFCFKVYNFAGGHDDEAETVSMAVASEMEQYPSSCWG